MTALVATAVAIHTCSHEIPSVPDWFTELTVLAQHFARRGVLGAVCQQVRLARGRAGHSDVIDFVALLLGYAGSGGPTLEACCGRLRPCADPVMVLFGRVLIQPASCRPLGAGHSSGCAGRRCRHR